MLSFWRLRLSQYPIWGRFSVRVVLEFVRSLSKGLIISNLPLGCRIPSTSFSYFLTALCPFLGKSTSWKPLTSAFYLSPLKEYGIFTHNWMHNQFHKRQSFSGRSKSSKLMFCGLFYVLFYDGRRWFSRFSIFQSLLLFFLMSLNHLFLFLRYFLR